MPAMTDEPYLSIVVPAYNASATLRHALSSILKSPCPPGFSYEVIVVNDGSSDLNELQQIVASFPGVALLSHALNKGCSAARNTGIAASKGRFVTLLDADDRYVPNWAESFLAVCREMTDDVNVAWTTCSTEAGEKTNSSAMKSGPMTLSDFLNGRVVGEYNPVFRGDYVRQRLYVDLEMRRSCGVVSYIRFLEDGPFWISEQVMRIYNTHVQGSITDGALSSAGALEQVHCIETLLRLYGERIRHLAPRFYREKIRRLVYYKKMSHMPVSWRLLAGSFSMHEFHESAGLILLALVPQKLSGRLVAWGRHIGLIRKYG